MSDYEMTIGIECHVQLATKSKLFSYADNDAREREPNSVVSAIDYGLPGMLPVLNKRAVELAVKAGKALNASIAPISRFDRKHYFYPDLPKGYQTSQMYQPIILAGYVDTPLEDGSNLRVRIHHAHMEEDAGKLTHFSDYSLVDLNRAGTPLIEIVSEPDIHSPHAARAFATELYRLMTYAGVTHGDLYHGNMRFDVNISVAKKGASELGKRAEVKNLNSFRSVERAAEYEFKRQVDLMLKGEPVMQETRGWDDAKQKTTSQRSKEDAQDYRYMPDPDIPPIVLSNDEVVRLQSDMPQLPPEYRQQWQPLNLDRSIVNTLLASRDYAQLVSDVLNKSTVAAATRVAHWLSSVVTSDENTSSRTLAGVDDLIELVSMVEANELSSTNAKEVFVLLMNGQSNSRQIAKENHLLQLSDESTIIEIIDKVLADPASKKAIEDIKAGSDKAIGYLVGQVMKQSKGQANPGMAKDIIRQRI